MKAIDIPSKKVEGWALPVMPGECDIYNIYVILYIIYVMCRCNFVVCTALVKDLVISLDDWYMYNTCWGHGDVRQYDITDSTNPKFVGQVRILHDGQMSTAKFHTTNNYILHI